jgi:type II restriction enzyme
MMRRIESGQVANFLLLRYANPWAVTDIAAIHHSLITPDVIQKRNPLAITARRSGWVGCNILLDGIPPEGRITLMKDGLYLPKSEARRKFGATQALAEQPLKTRNCSRALLNLIRTLPSNRFTLREVYRFERELAALYPRNHNLRPKIRQQLQVLRDAGLLKFEGQGTYELTFAQ